MWFPFWGCVGSPTYYSHWTFEFCKPFYVNTEIYRPHDLGSSASWKCTRVSCRETSRVVGPSTNRQLDRISAGDSGTGSTVAFPPSSHRPCSHGVWADNHWFHPIGPDVQKPRRIPITPELSSGHPPHRQLDLETLTPGADSYRIQREKSCTWVVGYRRSTPLRSCIWSHTIYGAT